MLGGSLRTVRLGVKSLMLHKLRSLLTTMGLLFGVSSVVAMLAIGEGGSFEAQERIKALGSTNVLIRTMKPPTQDEQVSIFSAQIYGLSYKDADAMQAALPAVETVVRIRETTKRLHAGNQRAQPGVLIGTSPEFLSVAGMRLAEGRWLASQDLASYANVVVLGSGLARRLFPLANPLGQTLRADQERFVIIGVLEYLGRTSGSVGPSLDECAFIPMTTSRNWFGDLQVKRSGGALEIEQVELHEVKIKVRSPEEVIGTAQVIRTMMKDRHKEQDYSITVPLELLRQAEAEARIWSIVLASIAGISLLVGGIGIMNVMLATVTERTREIGIRRALGAKKGHIVFQFLVETLVLSCLGGLVGVALGMSIPTLVEYYAEMKTIVLPQHPIMAFSISAFVGVAFGLYPAWRAANMDPVEALRHE